MRGPLTAVLLASFVLAGCGETPRADDPPTADNVVTDPTDYSYLQNATPGSHIHDYWGGRDRVPVLTEESTAYSTCSGGCQDGMSAAWSRPDEGLIVPQGTKWVNGTFHFTPHPDSDFKTLELWVKTAEDAQLRKAMDIEAGVPFALESTRERNDPPHYVLSLWQFEVVAKTGGDVTIRGDYRWEVEAVRGLPLEAYPPHPDRWNGAMELQLLADQGSATLYYETPNSMTCYGGAAGDCPGPHAPDDGAVVPFDASNVEVRLGGNTQNLAVWFHGANTWEYEKVDGRAEGTDMVFDIPVELNADSPYAPQSLWEFRVGTDGPVPDAEVWTGVYTITVTAQK